VQVVADIETAPVTTQGPQIESHPRFPRRVNAGFIQIIDREHIKLRVYERGAEETLSCGHRRLCCRGCRHTTQAAG